jgi:PAS domain S-box-containing protein
MPPTTDAQGERVTQPTSTRSSPSRLAFSLPLDPVRLLRARDRLRDYLHQHGVSDRLVKEAVLAVEEACTNAVRHSDSREDLQIAASFEDGDLHLRVRDHGRGFDVGAFDPRAQPGLLASGGRGLYLMHRLMDQVDLVCDGGVDVRMVKNRALPRGIEARHPLSELAGPQTASPWSHLEARRLAVLDEIDEGFMAFDWEYRFIYVNEAGRRFTDRPASDLMGRVLWDVYPYLKDHEVGRLYREAMEIGKAGIIEFVSPVTGRWREQRIYPTPSGVSAYARDIDDRKRRELERDELAEALLESEERLRFHVENSPLAVVEWDADFVVRRWAGDAERLFGWTEEEAVGKTIADLRLVYEEDRPVLEHTRARLTDGTSGKVVVSSRNCARDGRILDCTWYNSVLFDGAGRMVSVMSLVLDDTERRRALAALARSEERQRHIATTLQESLMYPLPQVGGLEIGAVSRPAFRPELIGGDYYDVFEVRPGLVVATIADVMGKGIEAAGRTETVRSAIRAFASVDPSPGFILTKTNDLLLAHGVDGELVTAFLLALDVAQGYVTCASAGHPAPVLAGPWACDLLDMPFGLPLGSLPQQMTEVAFRLAAGDCLVLYTDGVSEARRGRELFGERRVVEAVCALQGSSAQAMAEGLLGAAADFAEKQRDDLQVVALRLA